MSRKILAAKERKGRKRKEQIAGMNLYSEFEQVTETLNREGIEYALCGGMAMAVYDLPRATHG